MFAVAVALMVARVLPALLALPLLATGMGLVAIAGGQLTWNDLFLGIWVDGSLRLAEPMVLAMLGGMLSSWLQKTGIAQQLVRGGAELAGDRPWLLSVLLLGLVAVLFSVIGGLGAVIMVATVVLPILQALGLRDYLCAGILLFGISLGGLLNPGNWAVYKTVLGLSDADVSRYALSVCGVMAIGAVIFTGVELWRTRLLTWSGWRWRSLTWPGLAGVAFWGLGRMTLPGWRWLVGWGLTICVLIGLVQGWRRWGQQPQLVWYAYLTPLVPLLLIVGFGIPFIPAFLLGLAYGFAVTLRRGSVNLLTGALLEGTASVAAAVVLLMGVGMTLSAVLGPSKTGAAAAWYTQNPETVWPILAAVQPLLTPWIPTAPLGYVVGFALLAPLALYRGPLNIWGLGYGMGGVLLSAGLPAGAVMGVLMSLGVIQGVCDPTNTHNVWLANAVGADVNLLLRKTFPYAWGIAVVGLILAASRYFH
ncbi:MAG: hypothetical protein NZL92_07655 [Gloeomargarita sp. SKYG116]|nr:hypothetical protein [Gloeomargarita sp. SKYG116]MDW8401556.1 hypothetical protein [Gloeomargarita sp. SKYGB_i_bin116]